MSAIAEKRNSEVSPNLISAVILAGCVSLKCCNKNNLNIKVIMPGINLKVLSSDGDEIFNSEMSDDCILANCAAEKDRKYYVELENPGLPLFRFMLSCGKNGGWFAAEKHLIGGVLSIMIADCKTSNFYRIHPTSYSDKVEDIKKNLMIDKKSDELFIVQKCSLPDEIFEKLPLEAVRKNKYLK
ncbi:MAG: hypothetical protein RBT69_10175 [Spirochaetia bacterium]|nr:hypothetical protein [Spirochaetia bacterium]